MLIKVSKIQIYIQINVISLSYSFFSFISGRPGIEILLKGVWWSRLWKEKFSKQYQAKLISDEFLISSKNQLFQRIEKSTLYGKLISTLSDNFREQCGPLWASIG